MSYTAPARIAANLTWNVVGTVLLDVIYLAGIAVGTIIVCVAALYVLFLAYGIADVGLRRIAFAMGWRWAAAHPDDGPPGTPADLWRYLALLTGSGAALGVLGWTVFRVFG